MEDLNYYTTADAFKYRTIQLPKELFVSKYYEGLSPVAIIIYGFLIDRAFLSIRNGWIENGHPYLYYKRKDFEKLLKLSNKTIINAFKELNKFELIYEEKQGMTKANKIFPLQYKHDTELDEYMCKNYTSKDVNSTSSDMNNLHRNNTNNNNIKRTNKSTATNFEQRHYSKEELMMLYCNYSPIENDK